VSGRREVPTIAALLAPLAGPARVYARHCRGSIHGEQVLLALRYFRRRAGRPLVVIWDRLNAHRAKVVQAFVAAHPADYRLEWLPPYAPELNPEELCNGAVKRALLNAVPASVEGLHRLARRAFCRLDHQPARLHGFFRHTGLRGTRFT
jgi:transposase